MPRPSSSLVKAIAAAGALLALAAPGRAEAPRVAPEFYATFAVAGFEQPVEVRQSGLKRRTDVATGAVVQSFISDRAHGALVVMTAAGRRRLALFFPLAAEETNAAMPLDFAQIQTAAARVNRLGGSTVAGRGCALWRYAGYLKRNGVVCVSPEGLVLQMTPDGRKTPLFQMLTLAFAHQDQSWFTPPAEYQVSVLPGVGGPVPPPDAPPVAAN